jgi:hypothetical protein
MPSHDDSGVAFMAELMRPSPCERRRSEMRALLALLLASLFALFPHDGIAEEKQIADVKELAGSWQGWVRTEFGRERATMVVQGDGTY